MVGYSGGPGKAESRKERWRRAGAGHRGKGLGQVIEASKDRRGGALGMTEARAQVKPDEWIGRGLGEGQGRG